MYAPLRYLVVRLMILGPPSDAKQPTFPPALLARTPVTVEAAGRPLPEVLDKIQKQIGLRLEVAKELTSQNVTVVFQELPLHDAAESLAAAVDGTWHQRRAADGVTAFVLGPSERRATRLRRFRREWQQAEERCVQMVLDEVERRLSAPTPEGTPISLHSYPALLFPVFRSLPRSVLRRVVAEGSDGFQLGNGVGADKAAQLVLPGRALSLAGRQAIRSFLDAVADRLTKDPPRVPMGPGVSPEVQDRAHQHTQQRIDEFRTLAERPEEMVIHLWTLRCPDSHGLSFDLFFQLSKPGSELAFDGKVAETHGPPLPELLEKPVDLLCAGAMETSPVDEATLNAPFGAARSDRALLEIARAAGVNLAADAYTRGEPYTLFVRGQPLSKVLGDWKKPYRGSQFWLGSTLVMRSRDWPYRCGREPPAAIADRWDTSLKRQGVLSFADYLLAATAVRDRQIQGLWNHLDERGTAKHREAAYRLSRHRHVLRGWTRLTAAQKREVASARGLMLGKLTVQQKAAWQRAISPYELLTAGAAGSVLRLRTTPAESAEQAIPNFLLLGLPAMPPVDLVYPK